MYYSECFTFRASDKGFPSLSSSTNVLVEVNDVQDQTPFFVNAPYSATVEENTPAVNVSRIKLFSEVIKSLIFQGTSIFNILVRDGDTGFPREIELSLVGDREGFFELDVGGHDETGKECRRDVKYSN